MTMLWLPKVKELIVPSMRPVVGLRGRYKIEAVDKFSGKKRVLADWFDNLITTNGANLLGTGTIATTCVVGSGNTPPALTDTALQAFVASTTSQNSATQSNATTPPYFGTLTVQYNFAAGVATGNLSEVGVGSAFNNLFSRALILDGGGSPTTITVLSSEALYVTYQLSQYVPTADVTGTVVIAGVTYSYTLRAAFATNNYWCLGTLGNGGCLNPNSGGTVSNGTISAVTGGITGTTSFQTSNSNASYSTGSFILQGTTTWGLTAGNVSGGVTAAQFFAGGNGGNNANRGVYQMSFSPAIPKDASHILTLTFQVGWTINSP